MALNRKPRVGDYVTWPGDKLYRVTEVEDDGIAWIRPVAGGDATCFVYYFRRNRTFNQLASFVEP